MYISFIMIWIIQINWSEYHYMLNLHRLTRCLLKIIVIYMYMLNTGFHDNIGTIHIPFFIMKGHIKNSPECIIYMSDNC